MVTVEADPVRVESRLAAGEISCPACGSGLLGGWGYARARRVEGLAGRVRPRRARCRSCAVTHVLLPVTMLLRRAYAAQTIWAVLVARAAGAGHRRIAAAVSVPVSTARGWVRRAAGRLDVLRSQFLQVAVTAGVDVPIPDTTGNSWRDVLAAVEVAAEAMRSRFGAVAVMGMVTAPLVAVACSGGRLLAPGWPPRPSGAAPTPVAPDGRPV